MSDWYCKLPDGVSGPFSLEELAFLKDHMPGYETARISETLHQIGVRLGRRIEGEYVVTDDDLTSSRHFDDGIARLGSYLTGYKLYGIEGLDIIQWSRHFRPETRVVLLTGNGTPEIEAEARRRGADAFLHKPLPLPELERVVAGLTGQAA